jgi:ribosome-binding protein aMBF1 (putative translation factor)
MPRTSDALAILDQLVGDDPALVPLMGQERLNARVAQMVYDARSAAQLTQKQLAERVGTTQSVIARLEDTEYEGHSLTMLARIAQALGLQLEIQFAGPAPRKKRARPKKAASS